MSRELHAIQVQRRDTIEGRAHNPGMHGWRTLAYVPPEKAADEIARQRARFGASAHTLDFRARAKNPRHAHVPPQTVSLGQALDLTTQFRDTRTTWDFEVKDWHMVTIPGAFDLAPGEAPLYLLRGTLDNAPARETNTHREGHIVIEYAAEKTGGAMGGWIAVIYVNGRRTVIDHRPDDRDKALRRAKEAAQDEAKHYSGDWTIEKREREQNVSMSFADAILIGITWLGSADQTTLHAAIETGDPDTVREIFERMWAREMPKRWPESGGAAERKERLEQREAWRVLIQAAKDNEPREHNPRTNKRSIPHASAETYERWHEREPDHVGEIDGLPDLIGYYVGRAMRIGYASDKWNARGDSIEYDHDFNEPGRIAPECWADNIELADARALVIVGGDMRITEDGID